MKILAILPNAVFMLDGRWTYTLELVVKNSKEKRSVYDTSTKTFPTSNAAKQAMREQLRFERIKHGL